MFGSPHVIRQAISTTQVMLLFRLNLKLFRSTYNYENNLLKLYYLYLDCICNETVSMHIAILFYKGSPLHEKLSLKTFHQIPNSPIP